MVHQVLEVLEVLEDPLGPEKELPCQSFPAALFNQLCVKEQIWIFFFLAPLRTVPVGPHEL